MQATQKILKLCPPNQAYAAAVTSASEEKWRFFNFFYSGEQTVDPKNRDHDQDTGSEGRPVFSGFQMPGEPGHCRARTKAPW